MFPFSECKLTVFVSGLIDIVAGKPGLKTKLSGTFNLNNVFGTEISLIAGSEYIVVETNNENKKNQYIVLYKGE